MVTQAVIMTIKLGEIISMFCDKCGAKIKNENAKFCDKCGNRITVTNNNIIQPVHPIPVLIVVKKFHIRPNAQNAENH